MPPADEAAKRIGEKHSSEAADQPAGSAVARRPTITDPVCVFAHHAPLTRSSGKEYILVTWYGPDDPDNAQNWTLRKKVAVLGVLCWLSASAL